MTKPCARECIWRRSITPAVSNCVSRVSAIAPVRRKLVAMQQEMGRRRGVVMDGRDIGTVVLPDATVRIFLTTAGRTTKPASAAKTKTNNKYPL